MRHWHTLINLIKRYDLRVVAEVGVARGENLSHVMAACPGIKVHAVDLWSPSDEYPDWDHADNHTAFRCVANRYPERVVEHRKPSEDAAQRLSGLDLVFIDGDHSYDGVRRDIEAWWPSLADGGWMSGHDYGSKRFTGVKQAVDDLLPNASVEHHPEEGCGVWYVRKC